MKPTKNSLPVTRREFIKKNVNLAATAVASSAITKAAFAAEKSSTSRMIGLQVGAVSFVDEGVGRVLDILQQRGAVNTIFLTTYTYGRGLAGRQIPGQIFPDQGSQESDAGLKGRFDLRT